MGKESRSCCLLHVFSRFPYLSLSLSSFPVTRWPSASFSPLFSLTRLHPSSFFFSYLFPFSLHRFALLLPHASLPLSLSFDVLFPVFKVSINALLRVCVCAFSRFRASCAARSYNLHIKRRFCNPIETRRHENLRATYEIHFFFFSSLIYYEFVCSSIYLPPFLLKSYDILREVVPYALYIFKTYFLIYI